MTVLVGGSLAGGGVVVNETLLDGRSFSRGDAGTYSAPGDVPVFYDGDDNTLRLDLGQTPIGEIAIENVTVGDILEGSTLPAGETNVVFLGGLPASTGFEETFIEIGHLTIEKWRCTQLKLSNIEAYELNLKWNASDGQSLSAVAGVPRARAIGGGNRADSMGTKGGYYDQIKIQAASSGVNGRVDVLRMSNIQSRGGPCVLDRLKVGILDVLYNESGAGDGLAAKDFVVSDTVVFKTLNNVDNVEIPVAP
jgi:hypothetical protein